MKTMHIIIYSELKEYGGGRETWLGYFLPRVSKAFDKINIYALDIDGSADKNLVSKIKENNIEQYFVKKLGVKNYVESIKQYLDNKLNTGDICLMVGSIVEGFLTKYLRRKNVKQIIWIRSIAAVEISNRHGKWTYPLLSWIEKANLSRCDLVITNGVDTFQYYAKYWKKGNNDRALICIPNAVDVKKYICNTDKWNDFAEIRAVFIGRFSQTKGLPIILSGIRKFNEAYPDLKKRLSINLWGAGELPCIELPENVKVCGIALRDEVPNILHTTHIEFFMILPNDKSSGGVSHSLLEGLASGCICICSDIPAYRQVIVDGENGFLVKLDNGSNLSNILLKVCTMEKKKLEEIALRARETASLYSIDNHIDKFIQSVAEYE